MERIKVVQLVENGRQVGGERFFIKNEEPFYENAAIQKYQGNYYVSITLIAESNMAGEVFEIDEVVVFSTFDDAIAYLSKESSICFDDMTPLKGQKLFTPPHTFSVRHGIEKTI